jgi:phosphonoacetaldehyde hydrolase
MFVELGAWPAAACVKVDDTSPGIAEGLAAGCWTVGIAVTGNAMGLTAQEIAGLPANEFASRREVARSSLEETGAHVVVDSVAELPGVLDAIEYAQSETKL